MKFSAQLQAFRNKVTERYTNVKRLSALDLFSAIVMETPVDKGVLRNNWYVEMGRPSRQTTSEADESGNSTINRIKGELSRTTLITDIFFTNNLDYAIPVEFGGYPNPPKEGEGKTVNGYSRKAPRGMVRINAANWDKIVKYHARRLNRGR